jgi:hypothetical protein
MQNIDEILTELEQVSAQALDAAGAADTVTASALLAERGHLIQRLEAFTEPLCYVDWNRLVVIHSQGDRITAAIQATRAGLAGEVVENARGHALLECIRGVVNDGASPGRLNQNA